MTFDTHGLFAVSFVKAVVSQTSTTLVITVQTGDGALFASSNQQIVIGASSGFLTKLNAMIGRTTGKSTDTLTIDIQSANREGSNQRTVQVGDIVINGYTPKSLTDIESVVNTNSANITTNNSSIATINGRLPAGSVVGTTDAQPLTNKTIDYNSNTITNLPINTDGWTKTTDTLVYVSANSFKIVGSDKTAIYTKGTRIKFTNNSITYYGTVFSSSFSTDTTVTLFANSDFAINNSAITNSYYSYQSCPAGYPGLFNYDPAAAGFTGAVTYDRKQFMVVGAVVTVFLDFTGTSNATTFSCALPCAQAVSSTIGYPALVANNGAYAAAAGMIGSINNSTMAFATAANFAGGANTSNFTASGIKGVEGFFSYGF